MELRIRDLLRRRPATLLAARTHPDTRASEVLARMQREGLSSMPVVEHNLLIGVVTREELDDALRVEQELPPIPPGQKSRGWEPRNCR